jgi:pimeloyl-ACP methyl ester carboxylesterase
MFDVTIFPKRSLSAIQESAVPQGSCHWRMLFAALLGMFLACGSFVTTSSAQDDPAKKDDAAADDKPDGEDVTLHTHDGWNLAATYYPGANGKESIPIVLLHSTSGSRKDFTIGDGASVPFAKFLQDKGYAVLVPDFRFHGDSVREDAKTVKETAKDKAPAKATVVKPPRSQPYKEMVSADMLAVKRFLWKKNNEEKLNIDKLVLIGFESGADIAIEATLFDAIGWEQETPMVGALKLGRFIKTIILISPPASLPPFNPIAAIGDRTFPSDVGIMLVAGVGDQHGQHFKDFGLFKNKLEKLRPLAKNAAIEDKTLVMMPAPTKLQGVKLLKELSNYPDKIKYFIDLRVNNKQVSKENVWKKRTIPHED